MNSTGWKKLTGNAGKLLLAYLLVFSRSALAGQGQKLTDKPPQKAAQQLNQKQALTAAAQGQAEGAQGETSEKAVASEKFSGDGSQEGIKVHGHWTIEVRNPDGKLVTHREFQNSLSASSGNQTLASFLSRGSSVGTWVLQLYSSVSPNSTPCLTTTGTVAVCFIFEPTSVPTPSGNVFNSLTVAGPQSTPPNPNLVLGGTFTAGQSGQIDFVEADVRQCPNTTPPSTPSCTPLSQSGALTVRSLPTPVVVSQGQIVQVTVVISFS